MIEIIHSGKFMSAYIYGGQYFVEMNFKCKLTRADSLSLAEELVTANEKYVEHMQEKEKEYDTN